jgi:twitching motility protein PilT
VIERIDQAPLSAAECEALITGIIDPVRLQGASRPRARWTSATPSRASGATGPTRFASARACARPSGCIPNIPPTFADLRLPGQLTELLDFHQGLILVTGPAGGGKSTTLAAIINLINETKSDHIITLEDPIEFVHPAKSSLVNQREVGRHTGSFARALRAALREDPDVIMVGEMRDVDTIRMALTAAETGHLVMATMHTTSAVATVDRLIESFPPDEQAQVRMGLSESLKYVVSQSLVPRADGKGRVAVYEVLKGIMNVGTMIREQQDLPAPEPHADQPRGGDDDPRPEPRRPPRSGAHHAGVRVRAGRSQGDLRGAGRGVIEEVVVMPGARMARPPVAREEAPSERPSRPPVREEVLGRMARPTVAREEVAVERPSRPPMREEMPVERVSRPPMREEMPVERPSRSPLREATPIGRVSYAPSREEIPVERVSRPPMREEMPVERPSRPPVQDDFTFQTVPPPSSPGAREAVRAEPPGEVSGDTPGRTASTAFSS